ncbi:MULTISPECIES: aa3-type cytochrome oxidase subunit CtaJ [unclassified Geodermatophilus]
MTVVETLLVFLVAPLAVFVLLWALTYLPGGRKRQGVRYKPGQPWEHEPVWYEPQPKDAPTHAAGHGDTQAVGSSLYGEPAALEGGHSGHGTTTGSHVIAGSHGATAVSAGAPAPSAGGPLGGARGTW